LALVDHPQQILVQYQLVMQVLLLGSQLLVVVQDTLVRLLVLEVQAVVAMVAVLSMLVALERLGKAIMAVLEQHHWLMVLAVAVALVPLVQMEPDHRAAMVVSASNIQSVERPHITLAVVAHLDARRDLVIMAPAVLVVAAA
jgi:hypothetical protein